MIHLLSSFLLTDIQQVQSRLLKDGFGLEGNIFNCKLLDSEQTWKTISSNIRFINNKYGNVIKSLHFPIDQADYLTDSKVRKILFRFIDLANDYRIPIVVLHSNCIKDIESYSIKKLKGIRREYIDFYKTVDKYLDIKNTKVTIENMPIIGDHGVDFDSVFVFPSDFSDLDFKNIYVTWDIGHWAYTFYTCQTLNNFSEKITIEKTEFSDYLQIKDKIIHTHFSSFSDATYPHTNSICLEGKPPTEGDFDLEILKQAFVEINSWNKTVNMTLEIRESDYVNRKNIYTTVDWIKKILKK